MKKILLPICLYLMVISNASAGNYNGVTIAEVNIVRPGIARITGIGGIMATETSCSTIAGKAQFAFDATTALGKSWLSQLLLAQASGKKVNLLGNSTCVIYEAVEYEQVHNIHLLSN